MILVYRYLAEDDRVVVERSHQPVGVEGVAGVRPLRLEAR